MFIACSRTWPPYTWPNCQCEKEMWQRSCSFGRRTELHAGKVQFLLSVCEINCMSALKVDGSQCFELVNVFLVSLSVKNQSTLKIINKLTSVLLQIKVSCVCCQPVESWNYWNECFSLLFAVVSRKWIEHVWVQIPFRCCWRN